MKITKLALVTVLMVTGPAAMALPAFLTTFKGYYKPDPASDLAKASCKTCHQPTGFKVNLYGNDLCTAMAKTNTKVLTPEILKSIEALDSDKDGVSNIDEIKAGTLPGNPASFPPKK